MSKVLSNDYESNALLNQQEVFLGYVFGGGNFFHTFILLSVLWSIHKLKRFDSAWTRSYAQILNSDDYGDENNE
jgi:hypothetical protein